MHVAGIIAEYNPFHNGHLYQIEETKKNTKCDYLIVIMSGHFTQRGAAAITDKFTRTKMALLNGADMVLELPTVFATSSAESFAHYAVSSLHQTNLVNTLSFGSEAGDIKQLSTISDLLCHPTKVFEQLLKKYLKDGHSFPRAREKALLEHLENTPCSNALSAVIQSPNNILGIEYLKALKKINSPISPYTVKRTGTHYHDPFITSHIASATAIRHQIEQGLTSYTSCIPDSVNTLLKDVSVPNMNTLSGLMHFKLMFSKIDELYALWDIPKPLIHSFVNAITPKTSYQELTNLVTSKTYTRATVSRSLLRILLDIKALDMAPILDSGHVPYIRVLGCKKSATPLLKQLTKSSNVPVITNFSKQYNTLDNTCHTLLNYEINATKLYYFMQGNKQSMNQDFTSRFLLI